MQNLKDFDGDLHSRIEHLGGEPLAGSGFEDELPERDFAADLSEEE
jgi:hypothetical protein